MHYYFNHMQARTKARGFAVPTGLDYRVTIIAGMTSAPHVLMQHAKSLFANMIARQCTFANPAPEQYHGMYIVDWQSQSEGCR